MKKLAFLSVLLAGVLWGTMGIFVRRYHAAGMGSMDIVMVRTITTAILLLVFLMLYDRTLIHIQLKDVWCFVGTGICSIVFFNYCYFKAITFTSMSTAAVLLYTAPAFVMLMSRWLFSEKLTGIKLCSLAATFAGCVLVTGLVGDAAVLNIQGILVGLGSALGYALYSIFSRFALERGYHSFTIAFYTFGIAALGTLPLADRENAVAVTFSNGSMLGFSLAFGLVSTVLPYILYTFGLGHMENGKASIIASVEPVVATVLGIVLFQEKLTTGGAAGIVLVLGAIILCNVSPAKGHPDIRRYFKLIRRRR